MKKIRFLIIFGFLFFYDYIAIIGENTDSLSKSYNINFNVQKAEFRTLYDSALFYIDTDFPKSIFLAETALEKKTDAENFFQITKLYELLGTNYHELGDYQKAIYYYFEELKVLNENEGNVEHHIAVAYSNIAEAYRASSEFNMALEYLHKSLEIINKNNLEQDKIAIYNRLAAVHLEIATGKNDTNSCYIAIRYVDSSFIVAEKFDKNRLRINNLNILGSCNKFLGKHDKALEDYFEVLKIIDSTDGNLPNIYNNIANLYLSKEQYDEAIQYGEKSYSIAKVSGILVYIREAALVLYKAYEKKGDYLKAFNYSEEYYNISFKLYNDENRQRIMLTERKYEKEKNLQEIDHEKKNKRFFLGIIAFSTVLVFAFLFVRQRILRNKNIELAKNYDVISQQKETLTELDETKNKFISILSHDLKGPFWSMLELLKIYQKDFSKISEKDKQEYIDLIVDSGNNIYELLQRLLDWSKIQKSDIKIIPEEINLYDLVQSVLELYSIQITSKKINIYNNIGKDFLITTDKYFIDTILRNLINNAIKYTNELGSITFDAVRENGFIKISVKDTGVGITTEVQKLIFRYDKKISYPGTREEKGTGLGLLICKEMVEKLGGKIYFESKKDFGSKFTVMISIK